MTFAPAPRHWRIDAAGAVTAVGTRCWQSAASWVAGTRRHRRQIIDTIGRRPVTLAGCEEVAQQASGPERLARLLAVALSDMLIQRNAAEGTQQPLRLVMLALPRELDEASGTQVWSLTRKMLTAYGFSGTFDDANCYLFMQGPIAGMRALGALFAEDGLSQDSAVLAGVDSLVDPARLATDYVTDRLMSSDNPDGWVAGEAAAALLLTPTASNRATDNRHWIFHRPCVVQGNAPHLDPAKQPTSNAMSQAITEALKHAGWQSEHIGYLLSDHDGSTWRAHVHSRARLSVSDQLLGIPEWLPASVTGQIGAATAPLHWALATMRLQVDATPPNSVLSSVLDDGPWAGAVAMERTLAI